jgi:hypothetical protein
MKNDLACRLKASDRIWLVFDNIAGYPSSSQILSLQATVLYSISKRLVIDAPLPHFPVPVPCPAAGARAAPAWRGGREEGAEQGARSALRWPWEAPGRVVPSRSPLPLPGGAVGGGDRSACKTSSNCSPARPGPSAPGRPAAVSRVGACSELRGLPRGLGVLKAASWLYS